MTATALSATQKADEGAWAALGQLITFVLFLALGTLYYAFVIAKLWAWFIVPIFPVAPLSLVTAAGIDLLASILRGPGPETKPDKRTLPQLLAAGFKRLATFPTVILLFGGIVHQFAAR